MNEFGTDVNRPGEIVVVLDATGCPMPTRVV